MSHSISIGGDHAGFELKQEVIKHLESRGVTVKDHGPYANDSVDYPDFVHPVCKDILEGVASEGILICGSGNGVAITANKYSGIRCGLCWTPEIAILTKQHNNANAIAIPARFIENATALAIVDAYLDHEFEGGRHQRRVDKITPDNSYLC